MASPWSVLGQQQTPPGQNYFANMNLNPEDEDGALPAGAPGANPLSVQSRNPSQLSMTGPMMDMMNMPALAKAMGSKNMVEDKEVADSKKTDTNKKFMSPEQYAQLQQMVMGSSPIQGQLQDADGMRGLLKAQADAGLAKNHIDLKPLAAWADLQNAKSGTKSDLAAASAAPDDDAAGVMAGIQGLQKQRATIQNEATSAMKGLAAGSTTDSNSDLISKLLLAQQGGGGAGGAAGQARLDALRMRAGQSFDNDSILKAMTNNQNSLARGQSVLDNPKAVVNAAMLNDVKQDYLNALTPGGSATEGKAERGIIETLTDMENRYKTKLGSQADIRDDPQGAKEIAQLKQQIAQINDDYNKAGSARVAELRKNFDHISDPGVQQTGYSKADALTQKFNPPKVAEAPVAAATGSNAKPATVIQNGHTYTLNPKTGDYE